MLDEQLACVQQHDEVSPRVLTELRHALLTQVLASQLIIILHHLWSRRTDMTCSLPVQLTTGHCLLLDHSSPTQLITLGEENPVLDAHTRVTASTTYTTAHSSLVAIDKYQHHVHQARMPAAASHCDRGIAAHNAPGYPRQTTRRSC